MGTLELRSRMMGGTPFTTNANRSSRRHSPLMSSPVIPKLTFDAYTLRARILPTLIVGLPIGLAALAWFPKSASWWGPISGLVVGAGGVALLAQVGRDWGKRKQPRLFESWGGEPTTRLLRHRDAPNAVLLQRRP